MKKLDEARKDYDLLIPAFHYRNYDYYGIANLNIGLGYHLQLLTHFYPEWDEVDFNAEVAKFDPRCEVIEARDGLRLEI